MHVELSGEQVKQLRTCLLNRTNRDELRRLLRVTLDIVLDEIVNSTKPFGDIVFDLIEYLERQGIVEKLIDAFIQERPDFREELQAILEGKAPSRRQPLDPAQLRRFRVEFRDRRETIFILKAYKQLHEILHRLDGLIPQLETEGTSLAGQGTPIPDTTADDLEQWTEDAESWAVKTQDFGSPPLRVWVPRFQKAVADLLGKDAATYPLALRSIVQLPGQQLGPLNGKLVDCAKRLDVKHLLSLLDELPIAELQLTSPAASFRDPCERLIVLIQGHDLCQQIDSELRVARRSPETSTVSMDYWDDVLSWFRKLDDPGLRDSRVGSRRIERTLQAVGAYEESKHSAAAFDQLFEKFHDVFKKVDEALLDVTQQLVDAADPLSDKLEGFQ